MRGVALSRESKQGQGRDKEVGHQGNRGGTNGTKDCIGCNAVEAFNFNLFFSNVSIIQSL